ncbi:MAG: aromatic ring-hydroxylating dioxygenase subunit alpha [Actinobacteria bacterium]|nr:aromatic ring-hydroxylating dioxygenase subunit alpha [Actinomycetota bacterium]
MALREPYRRDGWLDDEALIARILQHLDRGTTDISQETWREPVEHYRSSARFEAEVRLLRHHAVPFCPSAALPESGSYVARVAAGVPIVVVRGRDGDTRAFRNVCRHRGAVVAGGSGCAKSLSCPYHGWTYRLDGTLQHVPDEYGFPGLVKEDRGLVPVSVSERGGLVFVEQDGDGSSSRSRAPDERWVDPRPVLLGSNEFTVHANWKVLTEGFLEGYHLRATHRTTFLPFGYDNVTVVEYCGPDSRVTFPFRRIEALRDAPRGQRNLDGTVTMVHHIFPNVIIARLSHHTTMVVLEPEAVDRTRFVTYQLVSGGTELLNGARNNNDDKAAARRDVEFVQLGAAEDNAVALAVQRGLASGANEFLEFGRFEGALTHFHKELRALIDGADESTPSRLGS